MRGTKCALIFFCILFIDICKDMIFNIILDILKLAYMGIKVIMCIVVIAFIVKLCSKKKR